MKYPTIFNSADMAILTKVDLAQAVEFNEGTALANIQAVPPGMQVFKVSAKNDRGIDAFLDCLRSRLADLRVALA